MPLRYLFLFLFSFCSMGLTQKYDWYPATEKKAPIVVFVHGGAWVSGDNPEHKYLGRDLAKKNI